MTKPKKYALFFFTSANPILAQLRPQLPDFLAETVNNCIKCGISDFRFCLRFNSEAAVAAQKPVVQALHGLQAAFPTLTLTLCLASADLQNFIFDAEYQTMFDHTLIFSSAEPNYKRRDQLFLHQLVARASVIFTNCTAKQAGRMQMIELAKTYRRPVLNLSYFLYNQKLRRAPKPPAYQQTISLSTIFYSQISSTARQKKLPVTTAR